MKKKYYSPVSEELEIVIDDIVLLSGAKDVFSEDESNDNTKDFIDWIQQ